MRRLTGYKSLIVTCILACSFLNAAQSQPAKHNDAVGGVSQIIETRHGRTSCRGVVIEFNVLTLKDTVGADQIAITEAKHGSDLKQLMIWKVEDGGKRLVIQFKPNTGDFGSGNCVTVAIRGSAFATEPVQIYVFQISTDPL